MISMNTFQKLSPARLIILLFFFAIVTGTVLLMFPISAMDGYSVSFVDALFTATSAVSSTGLTVLNTSEAFSQFGQVTIMILVQIGGLGFMTLGVLIALLLGKKIGMRTRLFIQASTQSVSGRGLVRLSIYIFAIALIFEGIATLILSIRFSADMPVGDAVYHGMFHAVTAFNNAGFTLFDDNLIDYRNDPFITYTILTLIIVGGLGFIVIVDLFQKRKWRQFTLHTKIVLIGSAFLILFGTLALFLIELLNGNPVSATSFLKNFEAALFQSVTSRSAGYNTVEIGGLLTSSQFIIIILMFIGAASGSTGGGVKVNTFFIVILAAFTTFRGGGPIQFLRRTIPVDAVMRALAVVLSAIVAVVILTIILSITEGLLLDGFLVVLFEAVSALSTAGLSTGLTPELTDPGKIVVSVAMLIGRLGPLTLAYALARRIKTTKVNYPEEKMLIG